MSPPLPPADLKFGTMLYTDIRPFQIFYLEGARKFLSSRVHGLWRDYGETEISWQSRPNISPRLCYDHPKFHRKLYLVCFTCFALLQIPSALAPNIETLIAMRTLSGFFGSVGIANGGGTISDMFEPSQRAGVFGWYLLGPLLGPTLVCITFCALPCNDANLSVRALSSAV